MCWEKTRGRSQQVDLFPPAAVEHVVRPEAGLDFADVPAPQQEHAQARLADSAADAVRQPLVQQQSVPRQVQTVAASANGALADQRLGVHPDTHGRKLKPCRPSPVGVDQSS